MRRGTFQSRAVLDPILNTGRLTMAKFISIAIFLITAGAAYGQNSSVAPAPDNPAPGQVLNRDHLTSTGQTVPRPGVPQASGPTALDREIQQRDNRTDNSICKGC
jgi:hypothetical protein